MGETLDDLDFPVAMEEVFDVEGKPIPRYRAIRRTDTGKTLSIVSQHYKLKSHVDALGPIVKQLGNSWAISSIKLENEGARAYVKAINPKFSVTVPGDENKIAPQLILRNSFDRTLKLGADIGFYRFICSNGLKVVLDGFPDLSLRATHFGEVNEKFDDLLERIGLFTEKIPQLAEQYNALTKKIVSTDVATDILHEVVGEKKTEVVLLYWQGQGKGIDGKPTAWNLYNAISQYLSNDYLGAEHLSNEHNAKALKTLLSL